MRVQLFIIQHMDCFVFKRSRMIKKAIINVVIKEFLLILNDIVFGWIIYLGSNNPLYGF